MGDGSSEWVMALHVLCQGALVGGVIGALGAVKPVQVLQVRSYVRLHVLRYSALKVVFIASENLMRSYVRLHVLPSPALKVVVHAYENHLFDAQWPDIKCEIFVNFENWYISILLVSRRWRRRLSRGWLWTR